MSDKNASSWLRAGFLTCLLLLLFACSGDNPEDLLRRQIASMETAVEARKPADFLQYVTEDFSGENGQLDRQQLRGVLASQLVGNQSVSVTLGPPEIKVTGDRATVKVSALVLGGRFLPERGQTLAIESAWILEGGEWRCYAATWR